MLTFHKPPSRILSAVMSDLSLLEMSPSPREDISLPPEAQRTLCSCQITAFERGSTTRLFDAGSGRLSSTRAGGKALSLSDASDMILLRMKRNREPMSVQVSGDRQLLLGHCAFVCPFTELTNGMKVN